MKSSHNNDSQNAHLWIELCIISIYLILQVHFSLVLYTHYKNAQLAKEKGGCQVQQDIIQMASVVSKTMEDSTAEWGQHY